MKICFYIFFSRKCYTLQALRVLLSLFLSWHSSWELHMIMIHWPYRAAHRIGQVRRRLAHNLSCEIWEQSVSMPQMPQRPLCSMNIKWNRPDGSVFKALATKTSNLCSITGFHMVEGQNQCPQIFLWFLNPCCGTDSTQTNSDTHT